MLLVTPGIVETESLKPVDVDLNQSSGFDAETQAIIDQAKQNQATGGNYGEMIDNPYLLDPEAIAAFVEMGIDPTGKDETRENFGPLKYFHWKRDRSAHYLR